MGKYAIEIEGLKKRFDDFELKGIDISVPTGCIAGFIGDNGAGKTTTIKLMLNLLKRDSGQISLLGLDNIKDEAQIKQSIGAAFDECHFHDTICAADISAIMGKIFKAWDEKLYLALLDRFSLPQKPKLKTYSRGMKMKLSIAAALAHRPYLLLLDEATSGLDPVVRSEIMDIFMEFIQDENRTIFMSSHITSDLEKICDYIYFIHHGAIVLSGNKDDILDNYAIVKAKRGKLSKGEDPTLVAITDNAFGSDGLTNNRRSALKKYGPEAVIRATLEDIMLFYIKGDSACRGF